VHAPLVLLVAADSQTSRTSLSGWFRVPAQSGFPAAGGLRCSCGPAPTAIHDQLVPF